MDYFTPAAIKAAITWMQQQTAPNSISNIFLGDVLDAMVDITPDFSTLTNVQKRQLKNAMNSITTGSFTTSQLYSGFYQDYIKLNVSQQGYEDQQITADKTMYHENWLLGEAPYVVTIGEAIPAGNPPANTYFSFQTGDGQNIAFGGTLGGVPAGFEIATFSNSYNFNLNLYGVAGEAHFVEASVKFLNQVGDKQTVFPAVFSANGEGVKRTIVNEGEANNIKFIDVTKGMHLMFSFPKEMDGPSDGGYYRLQIPVTVTISVNGEVKGFDYFQQGQALQTLQVGWNDQFVYDIVAGDVIEVKFTDTAD